MIENIDTKEFDTKVREEELPVIVSFGTEWCEPYKKLQPLLEEMAMEYAGKIVFYHVDTDRSLELAMQYKIDGLPTLIAMLDGEEKAHVIGYQPKHRIVEHLIEKI